MCSDFYMRTVAEKSKLFDKLQIRYCTVCDAWNCRYKMTKNKFTSEIVVKFTGSEIWRFDSIIIISKVKTGYSGLETAVTCYDNDTGLKHYTRHLFITFWAENSTHVQPAWCTNYHATFVIWSPISQHLVFHTGHKAVGFHDTKCHKRILPNTNQTTTAVLQAACTRIVFTISSVPVHKYFYIQWSTFLQRHIID